MIENLRRSAAHVFVENLFEPVLGDEDFHHLKNVMRLRQGETVTCSDGNGSWVSSIWGDGLSVVGQVHTTAKPEKHLCVAVAPVKGDRTEWVIEKLVEIGIDKIIILSPTQHSVIRWTPDKALQILHRYQRIARSAAMQSRRVFLPDIVGSVALVDLGNLPGTGLIGYADPDGTTAIDEISTLVVGPEGGFSASEIDKAPTTVNLGSSILRSETAAIVGATLMVAHSGR